MCIVGMEEEKGGGGLTSFLIAECEYFTRPPSRAETRRCPPGWARSMRLVKDQPSRSLREGLEMEKVGKIEGKLLWVR